MIEALKFLSQLKSSEPPPVVHLMGEDDWIRDVVRKRIVAAWCGEDEVSRTRLVGTQGALEVGKSFGAASLFATRNVVVLSDPGPGEKGTALSSLGKNQLATLVEACQNIPKETDRLVIETATLKKTSSVHKSLEKIAVTVDTSPPKGASRRNWIELMTRREKANLAPKLLEAMTASETPLGAVLADLGKLALAVDEGQEVPIELWRELTQASPEVSVWEIGDHLTLGKTAQVFRAVTDLRGEGHTIHDLLPSLFLWNQQRLQIRSNQLEGGGKPPEGIHPFVLKKMGSQIERIPLERIRKEGMALYRLDRLSKQSRENPEIALEKSLASFSERKF